VFRNQRTLAGEPRAAGRAKCFREIRKRNATPEIMVSGGAVNRRLDLPDKPKRFRSEARFFDEIAGKADKVRRELVDGAHHFSRILDISLVMEISEMNKSAAALASLQVRHAEVRRIETALCRKRRCGQGQRGEAEKFSPGHRFHFLRDVRQA
jgi:hypothetical protein